MSRTNGLIGVAVAAAVLAGRLAGAAPGVCKPVQVCGPTEVTTPVAVCRPVKVHQRVEVCKPVKVHERVKVCGPVRVCEPVDAHVKHAAVREHFALLFASPKRLVIHHRERRGHETVYVTPGSAGPSSETNPSPAAAPQPVPPLPPPPSPPRA